MGFKCIISIILFTRPMISAFIPFISFIFLSSGAFSPESARAHLSSSDWLDFLNFFILLHKGGFKGLCDIPTG